MLLSFEILSPLSLSLQLSLMTSVLLLPIGGSIALWIHFSRYRTFALFVENLCTIPLILPPSVLGFYLLRLLGHQGMLGKIGLWLFGEPFAFTFTGLLIGSLIYSLPFTVQPLVRSLQELGPSPIELAKTLGAPPHSILRQVILPQIWKSVLSAFSLTFAHTMGEFGVVLMIGGNIPGRTQTASLAIYDLVEQMAFQEAHTLSFILVLLSLCILIALYALTSSSSNKACK